jgi:hypothetical protein
MVLDLLGDFSQSGVFELTVNQCRDQIKATPAFPGGRVCQSSERSFGAKYYWPDDPLVAEATARIKPRKS